MGFKEASEAIHTPRVEEAFTAINYLFACLANAFNIAHYVTALEDTDEVYHLTWMLNVEPFRWPTELQKFFVCFGTVKTTQIRSNSRTNMDNCINHIKSSFLNSNALDSNPHIRNFRNDIEICIMEVEYAISTQNNLKYSRFSGIISELRDVIFSTEPTPIRMLKADEIIKGILNALLENKKTRIPEYIFMNLHRFAKRLSSPITVSESYSNTIFGPYFILRKARGVVTNRALDREVIVRDVMWIRPLKQEPDAEGVRSAQQTNPTISLGYYISAIDKQVYEITSIAVRGTFVLIDAVAFLDRGETKSLCLYMPRIPLQRNPEAAFGSIIGTLRNTKRTGSWSMIPLRPKLSDSDLLRFHFVFSFFADCFSLGVYHDRISNYDPNIGELYQIFAENGLCGILYSQDWLRRAKQSDDGRIDGASVEVLQRRLQRFDGCFDRSGDYLTTLLGHIEMIKKEEQELFSDLGQAEREILDKILLHVFKQSEQTAINPLPDYDVSEVTDTLADPEITVSRPYVGSD